MPIDSDVSLAIPGCEPLGVSGSRRGRAAPAPAVAAVRNYADSLAENGIAAVKEWLNRIAEVRALATRLINAPSTDDVYFVPNTTHGIGVVAEGFPWKPATTSSLRPRNTRRISIRG